MGLHWLGWNGKLWPAMLRSGLAGKVSCGTVCVVRKAVAWPEWQVMVGFGRLWQGVAGVLRHVRLRCGAAG